ncbi:hypothetical protein [Shewanella maritima]|uniref:hypothetical protein n=1 Tax=Shewanella maritima TaxID=2520507 RepID=UPI0037359853
MVFTGGANKLFRIIILLTVVAIASYAMAWASENPVKDTIKIVKARKINDLRAQYNFTVLRRAMELTKPEFGEYSIQTVEQRIPSTRLRQLIVEGDVINTAMAVTNNEWERSALPVRIPLRRGILSYRLLLTHKEQLVEFAKITTVKQLKQKKVGLLRHWSTWETMTNLGYHVVNSYSYESIFTMLDRQRFDYVPRGIHEIYEELELREQQLTGLTVEPNLALYIPAPFYVFVSPNQPRLHQRLSQGLELMVQQGELASMLKLYYADYIERAAIAKRVILDVGNPVLPEKTPIDRKELWISWDDMSK